MHRVLATAATAVGISAVSVEEAVRGRLAVLARPLTGPQRVRAYAQLTDTVELISNLPLVPFDALSENQFQKLRALRLRIGASDIKIGAVALAHNLTLLTRNRRDFARIPGLVIADWSV
jgi:tRNA(fMet)-specific endonuclease VapC